MGIESKVQAHLAEYNALRLEIMHYSQRIDRITGIYLTVLFALSGYLLHPKTEFSITGLISRVINSADLLILFIIFGALNSALLIRVASFYSAVLSLAQYTHFVIRKRVHDLIGVSVLEWDSPPQTSAKKTWLALRATSQVIFSLIVESISIFIMHYSYSPALECGGMVFIIFLISCILFIASIICLLSVFFSGQYFHDPQRY